MKQFLILILSALIGFTSCTKEDSSRYEVHAVPHVSYEESDDTGIYTVKFDASASTGTIVYYDWYFLKDGNWVGFNRTTEKVFSTRLFNGPGSVIWGLQVVGPFGQLSGIVAVESPTEQPTAAPIVFNQQEQEQPETVETTTYSLKNTSNTFGLFAEFLNGLNQPEKIHIDAGAIVIIKAVSGSIQAPIDVIITAVDEELN